MTATRRQAILDDIATTLATITVANGYRTTVDTVERVLRQWDDIKPGARPWLGFGPNPEAPDVVVHSPSNRLDVRMEVLIAGCVEAESGAARTAAVSDLVDDVIGALYADIRRDGNAISTMMIDLASDEIHPDSHVHDGGTAYFVSRWAIQYYRTTEVSL
jgi:hypothetical protein